MTRVRAVSTLIIFDIDGTLIKEDKKAKYNYIRTIKDCYGIDPANSFQTYGKTDFQIFEEILLKHGITKSGIDFNKIEEKYVYYFAESLKKEKGALLPGVRGLLEHLSREENIRLAVETGNIERCARMKLTWHGLSRYFPIGGFGTDAASRTEIIRNAIARAENEYKRKFKKVIVVGDTVSDIKAATENHAVSIAVTTGHFSREELEKVKPNCILKDLKPIKKIVSMIKG